MLAAGAALGLATMAVAPAAMAAEGDWYFTGATKHGGTVAFTDGSSYAALLQITLGTESLDTYCIQRTVITNAGDGKTETSWAESGITNLDKVAWILHESVPGGKGLEALQANVVTYAAEKGIPLERDGIDMGEAVQGTQAAIWHFTDNARLATNNDADTLAVYTYLTDTAVNTGLTEAHHSVRVTGPGAEVHLGDTDRVGPFLVDTDLDGGVTVTGTGGTLVDGEGTPVTTAKKGDELWVQVDPTTPGATVKVTASGRGQMVLGRVFAPIDPANPTQTLITASTSTVPLSDTASTTWYLQPSIELPPAPEIPGTEKPTEPTPEPETPTPSPTPEPEPTPEVTPTPTPEPEPEVDEEQEEGDGVDAGATTEELAQTGGSLTAAALGGALLAGGAGLTLVARRHSA